MKQLYLLNTVPGTACPTIWQRLHGLRDDFPKLTTLNTIINRALGRDCTSENSGSESRDRYYVEENVNQELK